VNFIPTIGPFPPSRSAPQLVIAGNKAFMFFGFLECFEATSCDNYFYNDTYVANLAHDPVVWQSLTPTSTGSYPGLRTFFGADYWEDGGKIVVFGGVQYSVSLSVFNVYQDVWFYDVQANQWESISYPAGTGPGPRIGTPIKVYNDAFYVIGGFDPTFTGHNDVWKFDLVAHTWTQLLADSSDPNAPLGRYLYEAALDVSRGRYYFFAGNQIDNGVAHSTLNDTWYYDIARNVYVSVLPLQHATNIGRVHGAGLFYNGYFIVVDGGDDPNIPECPTISLAGPQAPTNSIILLNTNKVSNGWQEATLQVNTIGLKRIAGVVHHGTFYYTSGFGFACPSAASSVPLWNSYLFSVNLDSLIDQQPHSANSE